VKYPGAHHHIEAHQGHCIAGGHASHAVDVLCTLWACCGRAVHAVDMPRRCCGHAVHAVGMLWTCCARCGHAVHAVDMPRRCCGHAEQLAVKMMLCMHRDVALYYWVGGPAPHGVALRAAGYFTSTELKYWFPVSSTVLKYCPGVQQSH
jgi:hypothetical protein